MTVKDIGLCGLGNALVDIFVDLNEADFASLGFERGSMRLVEEGEQADLLKRFGSHKSVLVSGGSVANSVVAFRQLGGQSGFLASIGDDRYGLHYENEFNSLGIEMGNGVRVGEQTGTALCLITPDAERTMRVNLGVASRLSPKEVNEELIARSRWLFVEGYLLANPASGQDAVRHALRCARKHGTRIAFTFSEPWVVTTFPDLVNEVVSQCDLLFANEHEAKAYADAPEAEKAFEILSSRLPAVAVTLGSKGALVSYDGKQASAQAFPCEPLDLTGAGDMFAGALLYGIDSGTSLEKAVRGACFMSMQVIIRVGARLHAQAALYWTEATGKS